MAVVTWHEKDALIEAAVAQMRNVETVLDIGCGIMPQAYIRPLVHVCCEPYVEYVHELQKKIGGVERRDRNYIVLNMGWSEATKCFPENSIDTVFLVDVIEHLEKDEGRRLLALTERIASQQVVVFTPLGFMPQHHEDGKDAWGLDGASWQEHKSGWLPEDFGDDWCVHATKEFHLADNRGRPLATPFGAMWAIRTNASASSAGEHRLERERVLKSIESDLRKKESELVAMQLLLAQKEAAIRSLILARIEYKIRRSLSSVFRR